MGPAVRGAFTVTTEGVSWACAQCGSANPLEADECSACGAPFTAIMVAAGPAKAARDPGTAATWSLVFPGGGHVYVGLLGQAIARALVSLWVIAIAAFSASQRGPGATVVLVVFCLVAFGLWILSAHDAYREAELDPGAVILRGRRFVFLVLALLLLLTTVLVVAGLAGARTGS